MDRNQTSPYVGERGMLANEACSQLVNTTETETPKANDKLANVHSVSGKAYMLHAGKLRGASCTERHCNSSLGYRDKSSKLHRALRIVKQHAIWCHQTQRTLPGV